MIYGLKKELLGVTKQNKGLKDLTKLIKPAFTLEQLKEMNVPDNEINDYTKFQVFPIELLVKADWNYKGENEETSKKLTANIKRNGQVENVQVRLLETGYYEVVNGNHRLDSLVQLGRKFIVAYNHGVISLSEAKRVAIETNETKFDTDNIKLSELISDINKDFSLDELVETMPFSLDELNNFNTLTSFDWSNFGSTENSESTDNDNSNTDNNENLDLVEIKLSVTKEVFTLWGEWKKRLKEIYPDTKLTDNKAFEFAIAESMSSQFNEDDSYLEE